MRHVRIEIGQRDQRQDAGKNKRAAFESESETVGKEIAKRGSERVGEQDRDPIENLGLAAGDVAGLALLNYPYAWIRDYALDTIRL